jgi:DNA-binding LacI/PurR family transcriptional regulator
MKEVAEMAGVSIATVSRVINGRGTSSRPVEKAVQDAIARTGFRPNAIGRGLKMARTRTLGVVIPSLRNPIFADAVQGIERQSEAAGYSVLLTCSNYQPEKEIAALEVLLSNRADGVLLTVANERDSAALKLLRRERAPYVLLFNPALDPEVSTVAIDDVTAARAVVKDLIHHGHRTIAMIAGTFRASDRSELRRRGFADEILFNGLRPGRVVEAAFDSPDLRTECRALMNGHDAPTAIFCSTDMLAMAAIRSLHQLGYAVPADVSVAGFDGIALGSWMTPSLTTVLQPAEQIGAAAVRHLLDRLHNAAPPRHITLPFEFRTGESSGRAPPEGAKKATGPLVRKSRRATAPQ